MTRSQHLLLREVEPQLTHDLKMLLCEAGETALVAQVDELSIVERRNHCHGSDFYMVRWFGGYWGSEHRTLALQLGALHVDVVGDRIVSIEVLRQPTHAEPDPPIYLSGSLADHLGRARTRLLMLNPNTSGGITKLLATIAGPAAAPDTDVMAMTGTRGVPYIASRTEAAVAAVVVLEMLAKHGTKFDAAIIAAFGDPGLGAARELFPFPVIGLAEAGMLSACMLGGRFGIVTFSPALEAWYHECVAWHGLTGRCAGVFALRGGFNTVATVAAEQADALVSLAHEAVAGGADVVVLAGAPLSGLAATVCNRIPVPVVDCVVAAVKQAEALVALRPRKATAGSFRRPGPKPVTGMDGALADWIALVGSEG